MQKHSFVNSHTAHFFLRVCDNSYTKYRTVRGGFFTCSKYTLEVITFI